MLLTIRRESFILITSLLFAPLISFAQQIVVAGTVSHAQTNEPLMGVSITVKDSPNGVLTDEEGRYEINVQKGNIIHFSMIGMETQEVVVESARDYNIQLRDKTLDLDEVVVVGYSTQRKKDLNGAVSDIGVERLEKRNLTSFGQALQGEVAGIQVTTSARPGDASTIRIRGYGSLGNNRPLILVDGQEVGTMTTVDPNDIEKITVLKDASSAAIYGYRAANGVVLIETKKGKYDSQTLSYNTFAGWQEATNEVEMLNAEQYVALMNEATDNAGLPRFYDDQEVAFWQGKQGSDWQDAMLRRGFMQNHHLGYRGGTGNSTYSLGLGILDQDGIYQETDFTRYNIRINSEHTFKERLKIGQHLSYNHTIQNTGGDFYISRVFILQPTIPVRTDDGWYGAGDPSNGETTLKNPVAMSELIRWENTQSHIFGNVYADLEIAKGLNIRSRFGLDRRLTEKDYYEPGYTLGVITQAAFADMADFKDLTWDWDNWLTYKRLFNEKHLVNFVAGSWMRRHHNTWFLAKGFGFPSPFVQTIGSVTENLEIAGGWTEYRMMSFFSKFDYAYDDKYFLSGSLRRDGSSRFDRDNRWGTFPSIGLGWRLSEEKFWEPIKSFLDEFKLRGSWGQLGNSAIGDYEYQSLVNFGLNYILGASQQIAQGGAPVFINNEDIRWETTAQTNLGLDLGLFNSKLFIKADYFIKNTFDILLNVPVPAIVGAVNAPRQNVGLVKNEGWEFELKFSDTWGPFNFTTGGTLAFLENEVIDFNGISFTTGREGYSHIYQEGYPLRSIFGYKTAGIFQNEEQLDQLPHFPGAEPGDLIFVDINEDGVINASDRTVLGNAIPDYTLGYHLSFNVKGFDFNMLLQGAFGQSVMLADANFGGGRSFMDFAENLIIQRLDRWNGEGSSNTHPRLYFGGSPGKNNENSDFFVEDASYLRLKNIQLGYTLPRSITQKLGIDRLRIYVGGTNIWTKTAYTGFDPELAMEGSDSYGWDYPMAKTYLIGLNLDLK